MDIVFKVHRTIPNTEVHDVFINDFNCGHIEYNKKHRLVNFFLIKSLYYNVSLLKKIADYMDWLCDNEYYLHEAIEFSLFPGYNQCMVEKRTSIMGVIVFDIQSFVQYKPHAFFANEIRQIINFIRGKGQLQKLISWKRVGF
jgi:hypothetical protein